VLNPKELMPPSPLQKTINAALGIEPCDLIIRNTRYLDVFSCQWRMGDIAIHGGTIVGLDDGLKAKREIDGKGRSVVPGFIDAHVHVESSLLMPSQFEAAVLPKGTTTAVCDPHELANVQGISGVDYFLREAQNLQLDLRVMLSSCVPATDMETNGGGTIRASELLKLASHPKALGLAEMMNVPGVLFGDPIVHEKLEAFQKGIIDGHCPLLRGRELSAYASAGISSCHESSQLAEAQEKLTKGISIWIREGSVAKDLQALIPLLTMATSTSIGFCTDDRNPLDIAAEGHVDHLVREAIHGGVSSEVAYRAASWSVARHYGLKRKGAIAPGYAADLVILEDAQACALHSVLKSGTPVQELELGASKAQKTVNTIRASAPEPKDLEGPSGRVHVIGVQHGKIITDRAVMNHDDPGVARLSVLERYGRGSAPANGYVTGFGKNFRGAIASSVGHDSHNLIVVGKKTEDMRVALASLIECGGGFCVVENGAVQARLPLPFGGLMSAQTHREVADQLIHLKQASRAVGCGLPEPFLQLAFLSLPVIPSLKLTDRGLVDVDQFRIIDVRAS
jgi:adenine deaminase